MRIAVVHSFYSEHEPSGENQAVVDQVRLLQEAGHDVHLLAARTDDLGNEWGYEVRAALRTATTFGRSPLNRIVRLKPDVVHVHNLFPNLSSHWVRSSPAPVVATLHNFRPMCANGLLFRGERTCTECLDFGSRAAIRHRCYRASRLATAPLAWRTARGAGSNPLLSGARRLVCLNPTAARMYERFGVPASRIRIIPNGISPRPESAVHVPANGRWAFVGRLSPEKGIQGLLAEWPEDRELDVFGDGPQRPLLEPASSATFRGPVPREALRSHLGSYEGLIFPSQCLEMQPTVVIEAFEAGIPVVALEGNAGADLVGQVGGGVVYRRGQLAQVLGAVASRREELGAEGREAFLMRFSPDAWLRAVEGLYAELVADA